MFGTCGAGVLLAHVKDEGTGVESRGGIPNLHKKGGGLVPSSLKPGHRVILQLVGVIVYNMYIQQQL